MAGARQISDSEKSQVLERQGLRCFIDNHVIESEDDVEFDHVHPYSEGGASSIENIAVVCKRHNRDKRNLSLSEYRDRLQLRAFFAGAHRRRLDDLLTEKLGSSGFGAPIALELVSGEAVLALDGQEVRSPVAECPATGWKYFFASVPSKFIQNDVELQPRALSQIASGSCTDIYFDTLNSSLQLVGS